MKKLLLLILIFTGCVKINAATYYFAANGDDARTSTQAKDSTTPWKSISKLNSFFGSLQPGDFVLFRRGDSFLGDILTGKSGTTALPITIGAYGTGARPIITGFVPVTGAWTLIDAAKGIYESSAISGMTTTSKCRVVTIDGVVYEIGRFPNSDASGGGYLTFETHTSNTVTDNNMQFDPTIWRGGEIGIRTSRYNFDIGTIDSVTNPVAGRTTFKVLQRSLDSFRMKGVNWIDGFGYILTNNPATLDKFGEWWFNTATQKLRICFGANSPTLYNIQVSSIDKLIEPRNPNIVFRDIQGSGANISAVWNDWSGVTNLKFVNCNFSQNGLNGLMLANKKTVLIDSCFFDQNLSCGIALGNRDTGVTISNTEVSNSGMLLGCMRVDDNGRVGNGIFYTGQPNSKGAHIYADTILNSGYMGIFFNGDSTVVEQNYVDTACINLDDGGCIYYVGQLNGSSIVVNHGDTIRNNTALHSIGTPFGTGTPITSQGTGIYLDDRGNNVVVSNNSSGYNNYHGIYIHNGANHKLYNNNLFGNRLSQISLQGSPNVQDVSNIDIKHNQAICTSASQLVYFFAGDANTFANYAKIDSNYESQAFNANNFAYRNWFGSGTNCCVNYTLATWRSSYNFDVHTSVAPVQVTNPYNLIFQTAGSTPLVIPFSCILVYTLDGVQYSNGYTVPPYGSVIFLKP